MAQTTNRSETSYNHTNIMQNAIDYNLLNINTMIPCKIIEVDNTTNRYTIEPLNYGVAVDGSPLAPPLIYSVPAMSTRGNNAGLIIEYAVGDKVVVGFCQRDITNIKKDWTLSKPNSYRKFSLSDGVIINYINNTLPTIFVKVTSAGIEINAPSLPVTVNSQSANINSNEIFLGENASRAVLLQDTSITATITGVQAGSDTVNTTIFATAGGSSVVKGKA